MSDYNELLAQSLDRIERKLDLSLQTVHEHEGALGMLKWLFSACIGVFGSLIAYLGFKG